MSKLVRINEITPEELSILNDIDRNCIEMHLPCPPKTFINMKVHEGGELVLDYDFRSKSWVRNAHNFLLATYVCRDLGTTYGAGATYVKRTDGGLLWCYEYIPNKPVGIVGNTNYGIVVGTGDDAESFEGYILKTKVAQGTGAGQLSYAAQNATTLSYDAGTKTWTATFVRIFNNNSGGAITITETAMYYLQGTDRYYMFCRDLLGSSVEVSNTAQLTVTYTMTYTFPA
jgi:hypothetical protein